VLYENTWQFEKRRAEVRCWMIISGLTHDAAADALAEALHMVVQEMFRLRRDATHVNSKFLHLVAWRCCLRIRCAGRLRQHVSSNPSKLSRTNLHGTGVAPRFPLLEDIVSENTRGLLVGRASSTEYMEFHGEKVLEAYRAA